jgi:hypothetical protein
MELFDILSAEICGREICAEDDDPSAQWPLEQKT